MRLTFSGTGEELAELFGIIREDGRTDDAIWEQIARLADSRAALAAAVAVYVPDIITAGQTTGDIMNPMEALAAEVAADKTVMGSAATLINGFSQRLADGIAAARSGDFAQLDQFQSDLAASRTDLAAAVAANTPGDPGTGGGAAAPKKHK